MSNLFKTETEGRRQYVHDNELEFHWNDMHTSIIGNYMSNLDSTCDFPELPSAETLINDQHLNKIFVVPRLNKFHETQNRISKSHLVEAFLSFLLRLLYHKTDSIVEPVKYRIDNLEKNLRFLLTIIGDVSWMNDHEAEFQSLLQDFEAVVNQAGSFVHALYFSTDRTFEEMDEALDAVLDQTKLLGAKVLSCMSIPAYTTSVVDSVLILDSVVDDLEDLLKREDDPIPGVKDQVSFLHQELLLLNSLINEMRSPQPSEIEELKEALMRVGGVAHQAEYLITSFLVEDAPFWYVINKLTDLSCEIGVIRTELRLITQKYQCGGVKVTEYFTAELPLQDKRNGEVNDVSIGFEDIATCILDQLAGVGKESLHVISVLGMPGIGKSTLAKKLFNHPLVNYTFVKLSWCVVSQTYKRQSVLANILIQINTELDKDRILEMEEETLFEHIYKTLKGRRYLIVMDDIWEFSAWDAFRRCFPDDGNGSRILLTSRNKDVAPSNSIIHELPLFSDEQCWELLEKKVFGSRTCPPVLQEIGKKIAAKCCGLPLTVVVIAGILSTVDEEESRWEEVGGSLASYTDGEDDLVMRILELSYKHLPDHLKPCFLYFGAFEEHKDISVGKLRRLWVAEGFIRKGNEKRKENIAEEYLMELIDRSLVMVAKRRIDGRGVKACVVHDLLRGLCLKKSKEESFLRYLNSDYHTSYEKCHRVRAYGDSATLSYCQHVRSFIGEYQFSSLYVRDMRLLRVLHFDILYGNLLHGTEYLVNLRFLVTASLPASIDRLLNLEYLCVRSLVTVYLPPSIEKMKKLRYIEAIFAEYGEGWNNCNTNNLEVLTLREFETETEKACPHFDLRFLTKLESLTLYFFHYNLKLEELNFPSNIKKLTLHDSRLRWGKMSIVGSLEYLEVLKLRKRAFEGERWDTSDGEFQKLRFLQLEEISLSEWNVESSEHFPKLQQLVLISCKNLQKIPSEIGEITTLELIEVKKECPDSLVESAERIKEEQWDMGNEDLRIIINTTDYWKSTSWVDSALDLIASGVDAVKEVLQSPHTRDSAFDLIASGIDAFKEVLQSPHTIHSALDLIASGIDASREVLHSPHTTDTGKPRRRQRLRIRRRLRILKRNKLGRNSHHIHTSNPTTISSTGKQRRWRQLRMRRPLRILWCKNNW